MNRLVPALVAVLALGLAGCTAAPEPTPSPTASAPPTPSAPQAPSGGALPSCDAITGALGTLGDGLTFDEALSTAQTFEEAYDQRVCVFTSTDGQRVGITISTIPFQQTELDSYNTLPNAISDDRTAEHSSVLQVFDVADAGGGPLTSVLFLFDTTYSISIQGTTAEGAPATLPQLTVEGAADAAFAVRDLIR